MAPSLGLALNQRARRNAAGLFALCLVNKLN